MKEQKVKFVDRSGTPAPKLNLWPATLIPKMDIEAEVERLTHIPAPANGHFFRFDLVNGEPVPRMESVMRLRTYRVEVRDGGVWVEE